MPDWLTIPAKKTDAVDFRKPLEKFIKFTFSEDVVTEYTDAIAELNKLRTNSVLNIPEKHESALEPLLRYYDQLAAMETKLPISESQIRLSFTWYDAFDKGSIWGSKKSSLSSGAYERLCLLYNIASLYSEVANAQNLHSDDGLKTAAKMFQYASGALQKLKDSVFAELHQVPTPDMSVESLSALSAIMLAQGQEAIWLKTEQDKMKDATVAKVAAQAADFYRDACRAAQATAVKQQWDKEWLLLLAAKQPYFEAIADYHQAAVAKDKGGYGEGVARLKRADQQMSNAAKQSAGNLDLKVWHDRIKRALKEAQKDNEFIYHDLVPSPDNLSVIGRATLAKSLPLPASSNFTDLFAQLVPLAVHQALQAYEARKAEIVSFEVGRQREGTQLMNSVLASLNLPAAIEDLQGDKVPKSVLDKSSEVTKKGGLDAIDKLMQDLPELLQRNREIIDETVRVMDEEESQDTQMRDRFKDKWTPKPSAELTEQLRQESSKYRGILENAVRADATVRERYNQHRRFMDLLCKSEAELAQALPSTGASSSSAAASPTVKELRRLLEQVDTIKAERDAMEQDMKISQDDLAVKFLSALAADGTIHGVEEIISGTLSDVYDPIRSQVTESMAKQEKVLASIQTTNEKFIQEKQSGKGVTERENMLKDLAKAYDAYMELLANLQEGTKFYNDFTPILVRFQQKISDLVFARKTEREELSRDLQNRIANQPAEATPAVPPHHQQGKTAPARPPPPQRPPAQAPASTASAPPPGHQAPYQPMATPGYGYQPYAGSYSPPGGIGAAGYTGYAPPLPPGYYYGMPPPGGYGYPPRGQQPPPGGYQPPRQ